MTFRFQGTVCLLSLVVTVSACRRSSEPMAEGPMNPAVSVHVVRAGALRDVATAPGVVVPSTAADWTIAAPEAGQVVELPKKEGDPVVIGDVLVRFDIPSVTQELAARELEVLEASARLERARREAARVGDLVERGLSPRNAQDRARQEETAAETHLTQANGGLTAARALESRTTLRARFPGVVAKVWHMPGDLVSGGTTDPVLRVIDPTQLQVSVQLPLAQLARIVSGQLATVRAIAGTTDEAAVVAMKMPTQDPNMATGEVRLSFVAAATLPLDTPVSVEILLEQRASALVVPNAAVRRDEGGAQFVLVVGTDGVARRREIRSGLVTKEATEVLSGVAAGDQVVTTGLDEIEDGTIVTVAR